MPEQIDLGEFSFDDTKVLKQLDDVKQRMFELRQEKKFNAEENKELEKAIRSLLKEQRELEEQGRRDTKQYQKVTEQIGILTEQQANLFKRNLDIGETNKRLGREYRNLEKAIASVSDADGNRISIQEAIVQATKDQGTSINAVRESNKKLLAIRNELDLSTERGQKAMEQINGELDKNNQFIKENVSQYEQQKINIGNYSSAIDNLFDRLNIGNSVLSKFIHNLISANAEAKGGTPAVSSFGAAFRPLITGFQGATKAALAFIATPIGAVLAALVAAFALVKNAINRSETAADGLTRAFAPIVGLINKILNALVPLGEFIINNLVEGIEHLIDVFVGGFNTLATVLEKVGLKSWAAGMRDFADSINEAAEANMALIDSEILLTNLNRKNTVQLARQSAELSKQKEIRDDANNSFAERNAAAQRALEIENEMANTQRVTAQLEFANNERRIQQQGEQTELLDKRAELTAKIIEIDKRAAEGRRRDQRRLQSLEREIAKDQKQRSDAAIAAQQKELDAALQAQNERLELFQAEQGFRAKTAEEELKIAQQVADKRLEILKQEQEAGRISITKYNAERLKMSNDLARKQAEITADNLKQELDAYVKNNESRLQKGELLTIGLVAQEINRLSAIAEKERNFEQKRFDLGIITQKELNARIDAINAEHAQKVEQIEAEREEQRKQKEALDAQNQILLQEQEFDNELERRSFQLERRRLLEVARAEKVGGDITAINKRFADMQMQLDAQVQAQKLQATSKVAGQISDIVGQESAVGKAAAVAQATIDTYQAANNALASIPFPFNLAAAATTIASGIKNVHKIVSTKSPDTNITIPRGERGMYIGGRRHYQGGELVEAEDGEVIINRNSVAMFPEILSSINQAGGGVAFAERGMAVGTSELTGVQREITDLIDTEALARELGDAVRQGSEQGSAAGSAKGSNTGIKELAVNTRIAEGAKF